ncbi:MAG: NAD(P)-dependent oxidoreductase [Opitutaceae bacterium]|jgi:phosphoglycerate dehydrogenase-like enzyme
MISPLSSAVLPVRQPREERVLLAVKHSEMEMFLPSIDWEKLTPHTRLHENLETMDATEWEALLRNFQPTVLISCWNTPPLPSNWLAEPDCPLHYICHLAGTVRSLVPRIFLERGGLITNWGGLAGETVAEHALLLALSALRRQPCWPDIISGPAPQPYVSPMLRLHTRTLRRRRVGLHGFGHVARALMSLLKPFDVEIAVFSDGVPASLIKTAGAVPCASLRELAGRSEVFFECESLTPRSTGSVNTEVIAALPRDALFVNVARGALVDEDALLVAARENRVRIALDVVSTDPIRPDSPFLDVPDAVLSPHIAGPTGDLFPECGRQAINNLSRYLNGQPTETRVTLDLYDRAT